MKHPKLPISIFLLALLTIPSAWPQVRRPRTTTPSAITPRIRKQVVPELAKADSQGRRASIVVLAASPVVEHIVSSTPTVTDARGVRHVDAAVVRRRMFSDEGDQYAQSLRVAKAPLVAQIQSRGIAVLSQAEHALNAIMIQANEDELNWLRSQPGVVSARFAAQRHLHLNSATTLIGAQQVWAQLGGSDKAGQGIKIGIIDSGIDITHPMFSDSGMTAPTGFPKSDNSANLAYTNGKVIVAKNYVCPPTGTCTTATGTFDHNASDGFGHGTGTASVAGGRCATSPVNGQICGTAPGAWLGNYKVFDATGSSTDAAFLQALNDAVADKMDVINYSAGSEAFDNSGNPILPSQSTDFAALHSAVNAGIVVTISSGNCGPYGDSSCSLFGDDTVWDPAIVPDVIAVGASSNSRVVGNAVTITANGISVPANLQKIAADNFPTPAIKTLGPGTIVDVATLDSIGFACSALPAGSLTGKIALVRFSYDGCGSAPDTTKINNAAAAGAAGLILIDNYPEEINQPQLNIGFNGGTIPAVLISYNDGANLQAFVAANAGAVQATFNSTILAAPQTADQVADYSSRGPANDFSIKPDVLAPGDMYMASQKVNPDPVNAIYDPSGYMFNEGTSYSSPMTAGAAAIVKQQHSTWTSHDIKSALVNTASAVTGTQDAVSVTVMQTGGGRLSLPAALATTLTADPVSISFGQIAAPSSSTNGSQAILLKNVGAVQEQFTVAVNPAVSDPAVKVTTDQSTITLGAGATATLGVKLALTGTVYGDFEGNVVLTSKSTSTIIHIPYWMMLGIPTINTGGLVDGAGFAKTVAPGDIVSLFGTGLGTQGVGAGFIPLPYDIDHTVVTITGRDVFSGNVEQAVPLFYTSSGQVNFQIPFSLATGRNDTVQVYRNNFVGNSITFQAAVAAPGIFNSGGVGAILHGATYAPVTASSPAAVGETVIIYCAGLGQTNPSVYEGDPGIIPPATTTLNPTVKIGGVTATAQFSGLAPFFAGLYQINAVVGAGTASGSQPVTITVSGNTSNSVTMSVK